MNVLINYATPQFYRSRVLNTATGYLTGGFDKVIEYSPEDIDRTFMQRNRAILRHGRGAGYWLWKPYIVKRTLDELQEGDFLFYADAASIFTGPVAPLIERMHKTGQDVVAFSRPSSREQECFWTKRDAFVLMDCDTPRYTRTRQFHDGFCLVRKTPFGMGIVEEWLHFAQDERILTDRSNRCGEPNYPGFKDHRHTQSIWSLLCKKHELTEAASYSLPGEVGPMKSGVGESSSSRHPNFIVVHRHRDRRYRDLPSRLGTAAARFVRRLRTRVQAGDASTARTT